MRPHKPIIIMIRIAIKKTLKQFKPSKDILLGQSKPHERRKKEEKKITEKIM